MAIGTSITPRSYSVDTTGRAYTLDPDPLLDVQQRAYVAQSENLRQSAAAVQKGVEFAEYLGARQQLGRVKARLGELDINSPTFSQEYAALVADNPLAFTNPKIAPVTQMAVKPVLTTAAQAMQDRAALQRAQIVAGNQQQMAGIRYGYQQEMAQQRAADQAALAETRFGYQQSLLNQRLAAGARKSTAAGQILFGGGVQPEGAPTQSVPRAEPVYDDEILNGGNNGYAPDLPADDSGAIIAPEADLLEPYPTPSGPPFSPIIEGEGDGPEVIPAQSQSSGISYGNGVLDSPTGVFDVTSLTADGVTARPRVVASKPKNVPEGYEAVPASFNPDGSERTWEVRPKAEANAAEDKMAMDALLGTDPAVATAYGAAESAKAQLDALKAAIPLTQDDDKPALAKQIEQATLAAANLANNAQVIQNQKRLEILAKTNPRAAKELAERQIEQLTQSMPVYGPFQEDLTATPTPFQPQAEQAPATPLPVREQISMRDQAPLRQTWTDEKRFVLSEAEKLDKALGYTPGTISNTVASGDLAGLSIILRDANSKKVNSPLLRKYTSQESLFGQKSALTWQRSSKLNRSFFDILREAVKDPNFYGSSPLEGGQTSPSGKRGVLRIVP